MDATDGGMEMMARHHAVVVARGPSMKAAMMEGAAGAGQAPDRVAAPQCRPFPPRRIARHLGDPEGMLPVWEAPTTVRAWDRAAGDVTGSVLGLGREVYRDSVGKSCDQWV